MAKIGLSYAAVAKHLATGKVDTFTDLGGIVKYDGKPSFDDVKLFASNKLHQSKKFFKPSNVTLDVADMDVDTLVYMFNATADTDGTGEVCYNINDVTANFVVGIVGTVEGADGATRYRAIILPKVTLAPTADAYETEGETRKYVTSTLEGVWYAADNGDYKLENTFDTLDAAKQYINSFAGTNVTNLKKEAETTT